MPKMGMPVTGLVADKSKQPAKHIATSDGMAAMEQRLSGAEQNKPMKPPKKGHGMASTTGKAPKTPVGPIAPAAAKSRAFRTAWNLTGKKTFGSK